MMMALVDALLQPDYSLSDPFRYANVNTEAYVCCKSEEDDLRSEIISTDNPVIKNSQENTTRKLVINVPNNYFSTMKIFDNTAVFKKTCIEYNKELGTTTLNITLTNEQKDKNRMGKHINTNIKIHTQKQKVINIMVKDRIKIFLLVHNIYISFSTIIGYTNKSHKTNNNRRNNRINNINIKHLKLFKSTISRIYYIYVYLYFYKQLITLYNKNINIHINDNIYDIHKLIKYNLIMLSTKEVTEIYLKLPTDLYNITALKIMEIILHENDWQRLELLFDTLCNKSKRIPNNFDIVCWNMQLRWTFLKRNPNNDWINEFTINCEAIPEEENMIVYTIADGKNVPIKVEWRPKQALLDSISKI